MFVILNSIQKSNESKYYSLKEIVPVPIKFSVTSDFIDKFQRSFIFMKPLIIPTITRNNYSRHCINNLIFDNTDTLEFNAEKTRVNLCVLLLEYKEDKSSNDFQKEFAANIISKYKQRVDEVILNKKTAKVI